jgi:hypothetical protein
MNTGSLQRKGKTDLIKVDNRQLLAGDTMKETTFFVKEYNFHGFELLGQFPSRDVGVDIQYLPVDRFCKARQNRKSTSSDGSLQWTLVNTHDFAHKAIFFFVQIVGGEDTRSNRTGTSSKFLKRTNKLEIFFQKDATGDLESFCI